MDIIVIQTGLTLQDDSYFGGILSGRDESNPVHLFLSHDALQRIKTFIDKQSEAKKQHDIYERQIYCHHTTVDGKCIDCGASEDEYCALQGEREARRRF